jgi:uncharacterized protein (DUF427 family)
VPSSTATDTTTGETTTGVRVERSAKRIRGYLDGHLVVDSDRPLLVYENGYWPQLYLPRAAVAAQLEDAGDPTTLRTGDEAARFDVVVPTARAAAAALVPVEPADARLADHVRFDWDALDTWFEEDQVMFGHLRDPFHRVDALPSGRHVQIHVDGTLVADSRTPVVVHETGLIPRYYLAMADVDQRLLAASETVTVCPYKGSTRYWHLQLGEQVLEDVAWAYPAPLPESAPIAGRVCFDDARVEVTIDGVVQPRPSSPLLADLLAD